jgi:Fe-S-cluster-containing dehydrogenase component
VKVFAFDLSICNGCYCCQIACKDEHVANDWMPYAKPQPDTGQFWVKVQENVRGTVPKVRVSYIPKMCMHCDDAPCLPVCKADAIYKRDDGLVIIDPKKCTGCKLCADACPYDAIYFNEGLNIAQKCTGCAHLLDDGWDMPRCVDNCAVGALKFGEESEFKDLRAQSAGEQPPGPKGRVFYMNWPKKFVAGTLYEPTEKEVIIGATCTLTDKASKQSWKVETNGFGDFWFEGLPDGGSYTLRLEKSGKAKVIDDIDGSKDVNLGDIPMGMA